ncbi:MAG: AmmeMemoRadiSam system protein B [Elusimicrobiota bacterium]
MEIWGPSAALPPLRSRLEAVPVEEDGRPLFLLRDLEDIAPSALAISSGAMLLASLLDGKRTAAEISALFAKATGEFLKPEDVLGLADQLDKALLLETPAVARKRDEVLRLFSRSSIRKAALAGSSYPAQPLELSALLGGFLKAPGGPGKDFCAEPLSDPPLLLASPHIDFHRGGPSYAWAYQALSHCRPPDVVLALGVAHMAPNSPWIMTRKSYETPYGAVETDSELCAVVQERLWYDGAADEWTHRGEHSLEFQAVWLKYLWRDKAPRWVPILCSSFERFCPEDPPSSVATIEKALMDIGEALKAYEKSGRRVMILAGVDLAHVGPRFGDEIEINDDLKAKIADEDKKSIDLALGMDADGFYRSATADGGWRKICGLSALYTGLRLAKAMGEARSRPPAGKARLLNYGQAPDPAGGIVSFCAAIFPS